MISGSGSTLFEELGLYYIGPIDGHSLRGAPLIDGEYDIVACNAHVVQ